MSGTVVDVKERDFLKVGMTREVKESFKAYYTGIGMKQWEAATKIFGWFMRQDDELRRLVLGLIPKSMEASIKRVLLERIGTDAEPTHLQKPAESVPTPKNTEVQRSGRRPM